MASAADAKLKTFVPGGGSAPWFLPDQLDLPFEGRTIGAAGSMAGSGAIMVMDETTDIPEAASTLTRFYAHESCGKCVPCREGGTWLERILTRVVEGHGTTDDPCSPAAPCSAVSPSAASPSAPARSRPGRRRRPVQGALPAPVDVVVVGGGISGLVAAREVARAGRASSSSRPATASAAGCSTTTSREGATIESGGAFIGPTQTHIAALAERARGADVPGVQHRQAASTSPRTTGRMEYYGTVPPDPTILPDAALLLTRIDQYAAEIPVDAPWTHPSAADWDQQTLGEWIRRNAVNADGVENLIACWTQPGLRRRPQRALVPLRALVRRVLGQREERRHLQPQLRHRGRRPGAALRRRLPADPAAAGPAARRRRGAGRARAPDRAEGPPRGRAHRPGHGHARSASIVAAPPPLVLDIDWFPRLPARRFSCCATSTWGS